MSIVVCKRGISLTIVIVLMMAPMLVEGNTDLQVSGTLLKSGEMVLTVDINLSGPEARNLRSAIDGSNFIPQVGLFGTGNDDGLIDDSEIKAYISLGYDYDHWTTTDCILTISVGSKVADCKATTDVAIVDMSERNSTSAAPIHIRVHSQYDIGHVKASEPQPVTIDTRVKDASLSIHLENRRPWKIVDISGAQIQEIHREKRYVDLETGIEGPPVTITILRVTPKDPTPEDTISLCIGVGFMFLAILPILYWKRK